MKSSKKLVNLQLTLIAVIGLVLSLGVFWFVRKDFRFIKYKSKTHNVEIKYPATWTFKENQNGAVAIFFSPLEGDLDLFKENVNIVVQDVSKGNVTLSQYTNLAIQQIVNIFQDKIQMVESEPTILAGAPAHRIVYIGKGGEGDTDMQIMHVWTLIKGRAYQVTYTTFASQYDKYLGKVQSMLRSFKVL